MTDKTSLDRIPPHYFAGMALVPLAFIGAMFYAPWVQCGVTVLLAVHIGWFVRLVIQIEEPQQALRRAQLYDVLGAAAASVAIHPGYWLLAACVWAGMLAAIAWSGVGAAMVCFFVVGLWSVRVLGGVIAQTERAQDMAQAAEQLGLDFSPTLTFGDLESGHPQREFTRLGAELKYRIRGRWRDYDVDVFDFDFGENDTKRRTAVILRSDAIELPSVFLQPRRLQGAVSRLLGGGELYGMDEELADRYSGKSEDAQAGFLLQGPPAKLLLERGDIVLEFGPGKFLMYADDTPVPARDVPRMLGEAARMLELLGQGRDAPAMSRV